MARKIFLSYSGVKSKRASEAFAFFLSKVIPAAEVVNIGTDIALGEDWRESIARRMAEAFVGILFLTDENIKKPWVMFEAGNLLATAELVVPYLLDVKLADVPQPFVPMQCVEAEREDTKRLIRKLASLNGDAADSATDGAVDLYWPMFESQIKAIPPGSGASKELVSVLGDSTIVIGSSKVNVASRDIQIRTNISTEQAFERIGAAMRQNLSELQKNFDQARSESSQFFRLTIIFASLGFVVLLAGVILMFAGQPVAGGVASAASIIPEATAALFFKKDRELRTTISSYHNHMLTSQKLLTMIDVCETISNITERDVMKKQIILRALDIA